MSSSDGFLLNAMKTTKHPQWQICTSDYLIQVDKAAKLSWSETKKKKKETAKRLML